MDIALCYESVLPARGGCETYIADLSRRLVRDGHRVHLYACRWDAAALPAGMHFHRLEVPTGPRFLRPWRFGRACEAALANAGHDVSVGFDKTWGQDVLYPQGGLHAASAAHNRLKYPYAWLRWLAGLLKHFDPASWSFARLERKQYLGPRRPVIVVNSRMVQRHFEQYYGIPPARVHIVPSAIDPERFRAEDRLRRRAEERARWEVGDTEPAALFVAMNYRLKGLAPLLHAFARVPAGRRLHLAVVGHPRTGRYERLARRLGVADRVRFLGFRADVRDAYFAADFLVHPTFYDPCSLVVLEALACGLPVITTRFNGASELLSPPEEGFVLDSPHDRAGLSAALDQLCEPWVRRECSAAARAAAARWTFEHHYQRLLEVLRLVAGRKQAA